MAALRIFYADDDPDVLLLMELVIEQINPAIELKLFSERLALEAGLREAGYQCDFVILDLNLGSSSGFEILQKHQQVILEKNLRFVIFTTSRDPLSIKRAFDLNAVLFVQKPNDIKSLEITIRRILENKLYKVSPESLNTFFIGAA